MLNKPLILIFSTLGQLPTKIIALAEKSCKLTDWTAYTKDSEKDSSQDTDLQIEILDFVAAHMERTLFKLKTGQIPDEKQYLYAISSAYLSQQIVVSPETEKFCLNFVFFLMRSQSINHFRLNGIGKGKNFEDGSTFFLQR